jgi:lysyl-tRNA synthetase class II
MKDVNSESRARYVVLLENPAERERKRERKRKGYISSLRAFSNHIPT